jgi:hypothetical protein
VTMIEISEIMHQNKHFFFFSCLSQVFCHNNKKLIQKLSENPIKFHLIRKDGG